MSLTSIDEDEAGGGGGGGDKSTSIGGDVGGSTGVTVPDGTVKPEDPSHHTLTDSTGKYAFVPEPRYYQVHYGQTNILTRRNRHIPSHCCIDRYRHSTNLSFIYSNSITQPKPSSIPRLYVQNL